MMRGMAIDMNDEQLHTLAQLQAFLDGTAVVEFAVAAEARYDFIACTVRRPMRCGARCRRTLQKRRVRAAFPVRNLTRGGWHSRFNVGFVGGRVQISKDSNGSGVRNRRIGIAAGQAEFAISGRNGPHS